MAIPLGALLASLAYQTYADRQAAIADAFQTTTRLSESAATRTQLVFVRARTILSALSTRAKVRAMDPADCDPLLADLRLLAPEYANVFTASAQGFLVCSALPVKPGQAAKAAEFGKQLDFEQVFSAREFTVGKVRPGTVAGRWVSHLAQPVLAEDGRLVGAISLPLDLVNHRPLIAQGGLPPGTVVGLVNSQGVVVARSEGAAQRVGRVSEAAATKVMLAQRKGVTRSLDYNGNDRFYAFTPVAGSDWIAWASRDANTVLAPAWRAGYERLATGLALVALVALLTLLAVKRFAGSIEAIAASIAAIRAGNRQARAPVGGPREFTHIAQELNGMLDARDKDEAALRAAHERFRGIVDSAMDAIVTVDETQRVVQFNPAAEAMFVISANDAMTKSLDTFIPARFRPDHGSALRAFGESGVTTRRMGSLGTLTALRTDGTEFPIEASISQMQSDGQRLYTVIHRDVTWRVEAEKLAKRQNDMYSALSDSNQAIVRMHDPESLYQEICRICVDHGHAIIAYIVLVDGDGSHARPVAWAGPAEDYLDGMEIPPPPGHGPGPITTALRTGRYYVSNDVASDPKTLFLRERQSKLGTRASAAFPFRRGGRIAGVICIHVDAPDFFVPKIVALLEEIAADLAFGLDNYDRGIAQQQALRLEAAASERFRTTFQSAPMAMSITTIEEGRLVDVNNAYCEFFEYSRETLVGRTVPELDLWLEPEARTAFTHLIAQGNGVRNLEVRFRTGKGRIRDALVSVESIEFMGRPHMLVMLADFTERRRAEDMLRTLNSTLEERVAERTTELETANRDLEAYGRTIAHDLRAPVRAMAGFASVLRASAKGKLSEVELGYLNRVEAAAIRMGAMVTDMLEFARSGRAPLERVPVDMNALAGEVLDELLSHTPLRPDVVRSNLPPALADPSLIRQVMVNLLSNALKFSSKVDHPRIEIGARRADGTVTYFVADNGCGFDPAESGRLFSPFERLHSASEYDGNGVGLAIVQRIVERHGGTVMAHSSEGKGAEFGFSLPA